MIDLNTMLSFFGVSLLLAAAPGPEVIFILGQSLTYGRKVGLMVALGNVGALIVPTVLTALGLGALIVASPLAYGGLRYVGAVYLVYLAYKAFTADTDPEAIDLDASAASPTKSLALRGAILCLTNPQTMTYYLAFLPQFIKVEAGHVPAQVMVLGLINAISTYVVFAVVAIASGFVRHQVENSPHIIRIIDRVTAVVLLGLAVRLVLD